MPHKYAMKAMICVFFFLSFKIVFELWTWTGMWCFPSISSSCFVFVSPVVFFFQRIKLSHVHAWSRLSPLLYFLSSTGFDLHLTFIAWPLHRNHFRSSGQPTDTATEMEKRKDAGPIKIDTILDTFIRYSIHQSSKASLQLTCKHLLNHFLILKCFRWW